MNIECGKETIEELSSNFKFNDAVLRNMVLKRKNAITEKSSILTGDSETKDDNNTPQTESMSNEESFAESGAENV